MSGWLKKGDGGILEFHGLDALSRRENLALVEIKILVIELGKEMPVEGLSPERLRMLEELVAEGEGRFREKITERELSGEALGIAPMRSEESIAVSDGMDRVARLIEAHEEVNKILNKEYGRVAIGDE